MNDKDQRVADAIREAAERGETSSPRPPSPPGPGSA